MLWIKFFPKIFRFRIFRKGQVLYIKTWGKNKCVKLCYVACLFKHIIVCIISKFLAEFEAKFGNWQLRVDFIINLEKNHTKWYPMKLFIPLFSPFRMDRRILPQFWLQILTSLSLFLLNCPSTMGNKMVLGTHCVVFSSSTVKTQWQSGDGEEHHLHAGCRPWHWFPEQWMGDSLERMRVMPSKIGRV